MADGRTRNWAFIGYEESLPDWWVEYLNDKHIPIFISPIHNKDIKDKETGELKKAHYHILLMYSGVKTEKQVKEITDHLGQPKPIKVEDKRGYARYLCHLDNPEKAQYDPKEVICLGGADYSIEITSSQGDLEKVLNDIEDFAEEMQIFSLFKLEKYARKEHPEWVHIIRQKHCYILDFLRSMQWDLMQEQQEREEREQFHRAGLANEGGSA